MKSTCHPSRFILALAVLPVAALSALSVTFTNDASISFSNSNYDGQEIVITNCTVTIDGTHAFANVHILNGGTLTHSFSPNGQLDNRVRVTGEQHVMSDTNPPTLNQTNIFPNTIVVTDIPGSTTYTQGVDYAVISFAGGPTQLLRVPGSAITDGSTVSVSYDFLGPPVDTGLNLAVTNDFEIELGGAVNANGRGYGAGAGPGAGASSYTNFPYPFFAGSGAGHGGYGGSSSTLAPGGNCYGSIIAPIDKGSGGGAGSGTGGAGGGAVRLLVGGRLRVDGQVTASGAAGANSHSGGGSAGSLWLSAQTFSGAGSVLAGGGAGEPSDGGGGGGGLIAIYYDTNQFTGNISAHGGAGATYGGAGLAYMQSSSNPVGQITADNDGGSGTNTLLSASGPFALTIRGGAIVQLSNTTTLASLSILSNSWLTPSADGSNLQLVVTGDATIQAGGGVTADRKGFLKGQGPGAGGYSFIRAGSYAGGGGGYGGYGGANGTNMAGGNAYGFAAQPVDRGSGGGGGFQSPNSQGSEGGGTIRLDVAGTLSLDGVITANGAPAREQGNGGGSGGSVWLTVGRLSGAGMVSANGGAGDLPLGGGGGGGRIAIYYGTNDFSGAVSAHGGGGAHYGGAGTVYTKASGDSFGQVIADNAGHLGTNTTLLAFGSIDLIVTGGAVVDTPNPSAGTGSQVRNLLIRSNSFLTPSRFPLQQALVVSNATILAGGGILLDGQGFGGMLGPGAGRSGFSGALGTTGGGAGFGGFGGASITNAAGGTSYGSISGLGPPGVGTAPTLAGSGGGNGGGIGTNNLGGAGGGGLQLTVSDTLFLDGVITADGRTGVGQWSGGGSGGGIWLTVGTFSGHGLISANGGAGDLPNGGGGGGGRIIINYTTSSFAGSLSARGGAGANSGGAGTIYSKAAGNSNAQLILDNAGARGANTLLSFSNAVDLTLSGGAQAYLSNVLTIGTLLIGPNSGLSYTSPYSPRVLTITSNATIQAGGSIILDAQGSPQGLGVGSNGTGSGGGYGGYGGNSLTNRGGGNSYGSVTSPVDVGSSGGTSPGFQAFSGGLGGGALHLTVGGTLALNGSISANGAPAFASGAGGGSGGSLWLSVGTLSGAGTISADGGAGDPPYGGGGGGGRIALYPNTNLFAGVVSARGGAGANYGGAGTIFYGQLRPALAKLIADNGGVHGTNTLALLEGTFDLTITGGAQMNLGGQPTLGNLLITSNSSLSYTASQAPRALLITSNALIQAGGGIIQDGQGFSRNAGPGVGGFVNSSGGGGGHGGYGGRSLANVAGGSSYGSMSSPIDLGSGGGSTFVEASSLDGYGGGALKLTVLGTLALDGRISADGIPASPLAGGGGSGGSLWLVVGKLSGAGAISANGGAGDLPGGGGGGGGRIAVYFGTNQFTGGFFARGGGGANYGGAGTIYLKANTNPFAQVLVDNGGSRGTNSSLASSGLFDLTVRGGAVIETPAFLPGTALQIRNLLVASNSFLTGSKSPPEQSSVLSVSNATILTGGGIVLDGQGFAGNQGPGAGRSSSSYYGATGGGGGYAGYGGASGLGSVGGNSYGSVSSPSDFGSGGGNGNGTPNLGGSGGGNLRLSISGALALDGRISADGLQGVGQGSGGGSGGSIWITAGTLSGSGALSANGAAGDPPYGGGGGGGRIAVYYGGSQFTGTISARGGPGAIYGGAGTVYLKPNNSQSGQVSIDNGGPLGTTTPLSLSNAFDLTVGGGAIVNPATGIVVGNLLVQSNAWLSQLALPFGNMQWTVLGNAVIQAGGGISLDGEGSSGGFGPGSGDSAHNGGGGYGGHGGNSPGGNVYGSLLQPADVGSGGGGNPSTGAAGGAGAGALHLIVSNSLALDGQISAAGGSGMFGGGGGSGGSIWLTVGNLSGAGVISADGGPGDFPSGGGGGGGRVALYYVANQFTGLFSAKGGAGTFFGGAGTLYSKSVSNLVGQVVVDNGGSSGTNTPLSSPEAFDLTLLGGAVVNSSGPALILSSLLVDSGASLTYLNSQSNLDLIVLGNTTIGSNGSITINGKGFSGADGGPGAGQMPSGSSGSGAGYGGPGGASAAGTPGGITYGSAAQPVDRGSRGGLDYPFYPNFCQGGGAVRMRVGGTLTLNGKLTANGNDALYDRAGGGAGGSIWLTTRELAGHGFITANGGGGEPVEGGGGGGGRIAIYSSTISLTGPIVAFGGFGASSGGNGTVVLALIPAPQVIAQSPTDIVSYAVSYVDLTFGSLMNASSASPADFIVDTPNGVLQQSSLAVTALDLGTFRISFPAQTASGYYEIQAGPAIQDIYGLSMAGAYVGSFVILPPVISGRVTDTNGLPVRFVTMRPSGGLSSDVTDATGSYSVEVLPSWTGTITPSRGTALFIPADRSYTNVTSDITNQNFVAVSSAALTLASQRQGTGMALRWYGINGVSYQLFYSLDLVNWLPYGSPIIGTNGPASILVPISTQPAAFFRFSTAY